MPMNQTPDRDPKGQPEAIDSVRENLDAMKSAASDARSSGDGFSAALAEAIANAMATAEEVRAAHFSAADAQDKALRTVEKGIDASITFQQTNGPRGATAIDRTAVLRDAAARTGLDAVASLGESVLGGPSTPSLAQRAAAAGQALEAAITRANTKWRNGIGRAEELDDVVAFERLKAVLASKEGRELHAFTMAMLSDPELDDRSWSRLDTVVRSLATDMLKHPPARDRARARFDTGDGGSMALGNRILAALDKAVEERTPKSIAIAGEALDSYKAIFRLLIAPNASFQTRDEYQRMRSRGESGLAAMLGTWTTDPGCWGRFLRPRPFTLPGWSPVAFTDRLTGKPVRR